MKVIIPWPHRDLNPNARKYWRRVSEQKAKEKSVAFYIARAAGVTKMDLPVLAVNVTFFPPDKRARDTDNMLASCKAALDGIAMAVGVDDSKWVLTIARSDMVRGGKVEVDF
jgi:crossover junction endodeoxyribonuclease RusA